MSDSVGGAEAVLEHGSVARRGQVERPLASTGVTCRHRRSGDGFVLGRGAYRFL